MEGLRPDLVVSDSPTQRIGDKPLEGFNKVEHVIAMQSLTDVFSNQELFDLILVLMKLWVMHMNI